MDGGLAQESGRAWQGDRLSRAVADRIGRSATIALLISPLGILFLSVIRLLIISDYNTATASAIVASGGYVDALLGTVIPLIPLLLPYLALVLLFVNRVVPGLLALLIGGVLRTHAPFLNHRGGSSTSARVRPRRCSTTSLVSAITAPGSPVIRWPGRPGG